MYDEELDRLFNNNLNQKSKTADIGNYYYFNKQTTFYQNNNYNVVLAYDKKVVDYLSFALCNLLKYYCPSHSEVHFVISGVEEGEYCFSSEIKKESILGFQYGSGSGNGVLFKINQGIEILYKGKFNNQSVSCHYQYLIEELDNGESLLKLVNLDDRKVVECFLISRKVDIENIHILQIEGKGIKGLFKVR